MSVFWEWQETDEGRWQKLWNPTDQKFIDPHDAHMLQVIYSEACKCWMAICDYRIVAFSSTSVLAMHAAEEAATRKWAREKEKDYPDFPMPPGDCSFADFERIFGEKILKPIKEDGMAIAELTIIINSLGDSCITGALWKLGRPIDGGGKALVRIDMRNATIHSFEALANDIQYLSKRGWQFTFDNYPT